MHGYFISLFSLTAPSHITLFKWKTAASLSNLDTEGSFYSFSLPLPPSVCFKTASQAKMIHESEFRKRINKNIYGLTFFSELQYFAVCQCVTQRWKQQFCISGYFEEKELSNRPNSMVSMLFYLNLLVHRFQSFL